MGSSFQRTLAYRVSGIALLLFLCTTARSSSAAIITVMDVRATAGTTRLEVPVTISGGEDIQNLSIAFSIGDGGPPLGGEETILITDVLYQGGTIFDGFDLVTSEGVSLPARGATIANATINAAGVDASAGGLTDFETAFVFILDISSATAGEELILNANAADLSAASNSRSENLSLTFNSGRLTVTAIPEPGSVAVLSLLGVVAYRFRKPIKTKNVA